MEIKELSTERENAEPRRRKRVEAGPGLCGQARELGTTETRASGCPESSCTKLLLNA